MSQLGGLPDMSQLGGLPDMSQGGGLFVAEDFYPKGETLSPSVASDATTVSSPRYSSAVFGVRSGTATGMLLFQSPFRSVMLQL